MMLLSSLGCAAVLLAPARPPRFCRVLIRFCQRSVPRRKKCVLPPVPFDVAIFFYNVLIDNNLEMGDAVTVANGEDITNVAKQFARRFEGRPLPRKIFFYCSRLMRCVEEQYRGLFEVLKAELGALLEFSFNYEFPSNVTQWQECDDTIFVLAMNVRELTAMQQLTHKHMPKHYVWWQTEQFSNTRFFKNPIWMHALSNAMWIWDYAEPNIEYLQPRVGNAVMTLVRHAFYAPTTLFKPLPADLLPRNAPPFVPAPAPPAAAATMVADTPSKVADVASEKKEEERKDVPSPFAAANITDLSTSALAPTVLASTVPAPPVPTVPPPALTPLSRADIRKAAMASIEKFQEAQNAKTTIPTSMMAVDEVLKQQQESSGSGSANAPLVASSSSPAEQQRAMLLQKRQRAGHPMKELLQQQMQQNQKQQNKLRQQFAQRQAERSIPSPFALAPPSKTASRSLVLANKNAGKTVAQLSAQQDAHWQQLRQRQLVSYNASSSATQRMSFAQQQQQKKALQGAGQQRTGMAAVPTTAPPPTSTNTVLPPSRSMIERRLARSIPQSPANSTVTAPDVSQPFDILLLGATSGQARLQCIQMLQTKYSLTVGTPPRGRYWYGEEREQNIRRALVCINVHYFRDPSIQETARMNLLLSNGSCVVSERSTAGDGLMDKRYNEAQAVVFVPQDDFDALGKACRQLVTDDVRRKEQQRKAVAFAMSEAQSIRKQTDTVIQILKLLYK